MMVIGSDYITATLTKNEVVKMRKLIGDTKSKIENDLKNCDSHYYLEICQLEAKLYGFMSLMAAQAMSDE